MFFGSNIKLLRKRKRRTQDDMAHALQMKRSTLSGYENNVAQPSIENLISISDYFKISIDTLLKVDLSNLSESKLSEIEKGYDVYIKGGQLRVLTTTIDSQNNENIELVPEKAKAGYSTGFADPEYISELPVFQLPFLSREKKYRTFQISGDSMLPVPEGAWITGEFVINWNEIKSGEAYIVLTLDEGIVFKIAENRLKERRCLRLHSLNPVYKPYELNVKQIKEVWRFVNFISNEMPGPRTQNEDLYSAMNQLQKDMEKIKLRLDLG